MGAGGKSAGKHFGEIGLFGSSATGYPDISKVNISTTSNTANFGDLSRWGGYNASAAQGGRGLWFGGKGYYSIFDYIDYVTIATAANSSTFGSMNYGKQRFAGCAGKGRAVVSGGEPSWSGYGYLDMFYVTIDTTSNSSTFGNATERKDSIPAGGSDGSRGLFGAGYLGGFGVSGGVYPQFKGIDYVTIATTGNASNFGDVYVDSSSNNRKGYFGGTGNGTVYEHFGGTVGSQYGSSYFGSSSYIGKVTVATTGNCIHWGHTAGDMVYPLGIFNNGTRSVYGGGAPAYNNLGNSVYSKAWYQDMTTGSNSTTFGNLLYQGSGTAQRKMGGAGLSGD